MSLLNCGRDLKIVSCLLTSGGAYRNFKKENFDELVGCYNRSSSGGNVGAAGA